MDKGIPLEDITTNDWNSSTNPSIYVATGPQRGTWSGRKISLNQGLPNVDKFVKMVQLKARVEKLEAFTEKYISYEFPHPKTRTSSHGPEVKRSLVNQQRDSFLTNLDKLGIHYQWDKKSYKVTLPSRDRKKADEAYKLIEQWYK